MALALLLAACSATSDPGADAGGLPGDDGGGPGPDAPVGAAGLVLELRGVPALTAALGGDFDAELEEVRIDLENVRAVGDAAPGDSRTTRDELRLEWYGAGDGDGEEEANNQPVVIAFDEAPPGLYSHVLAQVADYRLEGSVELAESERDFEIEDAPATPLAVAIPLGGVTLEAGETRRVTIEVSCADLVVETRWDQVEEEEGELRIHAGSPQIAAVREAMQAAFRYQGDGEVSSAP